MSSSIGVVPRLTAWGHKFMRVACQMVKRRSSWRKRSTIIHRRRNSSRKEAVGTSTTSTAAPTGLAAAPAACWNSISAPPSSSTSRAASENRVIRTERSRKKNMSSQSYATTSPSGRLGMRNSSKQQQHGMEELIPGLPDDLVLDCILTRVSWQQLTTLSSVSHSWWSILQSRGVYDARVQTKSTQQLLVVLHKLEGLKPVGVQFVSSPHADHALVGRDGGGGGGGGVGHRWNLAFNVSETDRGRSIPDTFGYGLSLHNPTTGSWILLPPIPSVGCGVPLFSELACVKGMLFVLGGRDHETWEPRREVFMLDLVAGNGVWRKRARMITPRASFGCGVIGNKLYVAGGHSDTFGALGSAEVYDPDLDVWEPIADMTDPRSCCAVAVHDKKLYVIGGYAWAGEKEHEVVKNNNAGGGGGGIDNDQMDVDEEGEWANCAQVFDVHRGEWKQFGNMKTLNDYDEQVCTVFDGELYSFSTFGVERYECSTNGWKQVYEDSWCMDEKDGDGWRMGGDASAPCLILSVAPVGKEIFAMVCIGDECDRGCTLLKSNGFGKPGPKLHWERASCPVKFVCAFPGLSALEVYRN